MTNRILRPSSERKILRVSRPLYSNDYGTKKKVYFFIPFSWEVFPYNFVNIAPIDLHLVPFESVGKMLPYTM